MPNAVTESQLLKLRAGDRLKYHGVEWQVVGYSTYHDPQGYNTSEWELKSSSGKEYYLLREKDPNNPEALTHWYIAEELRYPSITEPNSTYDLITRLWDDMQAGKTPYPELQVQNRTYAFESQTQGMYDEAGDQSSRVTWDYWDTAHQWNLALEAWKEGSLAVYSTKEVQIEEFSGIEKAPETHQFGQTSSASFDQTVASIPIWQLVCASTLLVVGIMMMLFG